MFSVDQERELVEQMQSGAADAAPARDQLILDLVDYVDAVFLPWFFVTHPTYRHLREDLRQEAHYAILHAVDRYRLGRKARLRTYAWYWVKHFVFKFVNEQPPKTLSLDGPPPEGMHVPEEGQENVQPPRPQEDDPKVLGECIPDSEPGPLAEAMRGESVERLMAVLDGLAPKQRDLITAYYGIGCEAQTTAELAARFGLPIWSVQWRLGRIREILRGRLGDKDGIPD